MMADEQFHENEAYEEPAPWKRAAFMLFFLFCFAIAEMILWVVAVAQFFWILFKVSPHPTFSRFSASLAAWVSETVRYLGAATSRKPFPFSA
jgi:hypothetical protein